MLNFVPVAAEAAARTAMSATSPITGIRYLAIPAPDGRTYGLRIEDVDEAPAERAPDLTFNSEEEAIDYADRFDFNQSVAEAAALPCTLECQATVDGEIVESYWPDRANAHARAQEILLKEYRAYMTPTRAKWWARRAVRLLKVYGRVETPDVVLTIKTSAASGDGK